jgi:hypothetical protein
MFKLVRPPYDAFILRTSRKEQGRRNNVKEPKQN